MLERYDTSGRRSLDADEITELVQDMVEKDAARRNYRRLAVIFLFFALAMLGATFGLTWVVVSSLKDTRLSPGGVLLPKSGSAQDAAAAGANAVQTAIVDIMVLNGSVLAARPQQQAAADSGAAAAAAGDDIGEASSVGLNSGPTLLETVAFTAYQTFTSQIDMDALAQLKQLRITSSATGAELLLTVQGAARLPDPASTYGSVLMLFTHVGTIELDGGRVRFKDDVAPVFRAAGFVTTSSSCCSSASSAGSSRRRLMARDASVGGVFGNKVTVQSAPSSDASSPPPLVRPSPAPVAGGGGTPSDAKATAAVDGRPGGSAHADASGSLRRSRGGGSMQQALFGSQDTPAGGGSSGAASSSKRPAHAREGRTRRATGRAATVRGANKLVLNLLPGNAHLVYLLLYNVHVSSDACSAARHRVPALFCCICCIWGRAGRWKARGLRMHP